MLRMSRMTDYGTVVLAHLAGEPRRVCSATDVAQATQLSPPSVSKLLKRLARAGLVESFRGTNGGYALARDAGSISAAQILDALEGPLALTECSADDSHCRLETVCGVGRAWQRINHSIRRALQDVSLAQLIDRGRPEIRFDFDIDGDAGTSGRRRSTPLRS